MILAIDPGPARSAWCAYADGRPISFGILDNSEILTSIRAWAPYDNHRIAIEMIASYGMPVGETVFVTCVWIGRFIQVAAEFRKECALIPRKDVKLYLCGQPRANDANIRRALLDRFGKKGTKKNPGMLYGIKEDMWSALAVAVTFADSHK